MRRINKILSRLGVCSRRDADALLQQGKVFVGDSDVPLVVGQQLDVTQHKYLIVNGKRIPLHNDKKNHTKIWAHHKKKGKIVSSRDPSALSKDSLLVPEMCEMLGVSHIIPVGRLDINSEGLILFTNNGDLAQQLMSSGLEREYMVRVKGPLEREALLPKFDKLAKSGIRINGVQ